MRIVFNPFRKERKSVKQKMRRKAINLWTNVEGSPYFILGRVEKKENFAFGIFSVGKAFGLDQVASREIVEIFFQKMSKQQIS